MKKMMLLVLLSSPWMAKGQEEIPLYTDEVPNSRQSSIVEESDIGEDGILRVSNVTVPTLTVYFPPKEIANTGKAVVICPGGGYHILAMSHEGHDVAKALANEGIAAFVLKYRLPHDGVMLNKTIGPLQDAQRAIQVVRERAGEWGIASDQIGVVGFSAGGHLASTLSTHYREALIANPHGTSLRPDFSLLVYPVISFKDEITHRGSRINLLGSDPTAEEIAWLSNELQVTDDTPPAFLVHAEDDTVVPIANSEGYVKALAPHGIEANLITYPKGGHGFGMNNSKTTEQWFDHFLKWLDRL